MVVRAEWKKSGKALIKRDHGKIQGATLPFFPPMATQNESKDDILGHLTGKIRVKG